MSTTTGAPIDTKAKISFGDGRYSTVMSELFGDTQRLLGLSKPQAEKVARAFGAELGRMNAHSEIKFGKRSKDGRMTLNESAKIKGIVVTYAVSIAKLCVLLQECKTYGMTDCDITLNENHMEWINKGLTEDTKPEDNQ